MKKKCFKIEIETQRANVFGSSQYHEQRFCVLWLTRVLTDIVFLFNSSSAPVTFDDTYIFGKKKTFLCSEYEKNGKNCIAYEKMQKIRVSG